MSTDQGIDSVEILLAHSLAIEREASERYTELAEQMDVHHNLEVAELFRRLAAIEAKHVAKVEALGAGRALPHIPPWEYQWDTRESPEAPAHDEAHYLMTPYHALSLALAGEQRAAEFFARVACTTSDAEVKALAERLHEEEREHVALIEAWRARHPAPAAGWDEDPDPPTSHE